MNPLVLVAPNAFKGSLTAAAAARAIARGVKEALPGAQTKLLPIADGGDGLMDALVGAWGGRIVRVPVRGPLGERRTAPYGWIARGEGGRPTAVVEMALASGLARARRRRPMKATTYGTGQLIAAALKRGAEVVVVGLGGSASSDGGAGMAQALGARLLDARSREIGPGADGLSTLARIEWRRPKGVRFIAVADVTNPLVGARGSARVYGPQKGATPAMIARIEAALKRYAAALKRDLGADVARRPGAGAAGGLGAGLMAFLGAELVAGTAFILKEVDALRWIRRSRAAITGEGRLDRTSFFGKAPIEFARLARSAGVPVACVCGGLDPAVRSSLWRSGLDAVVSFPEAGARGRDSYARASFWLEKTASIAVKRLLLAVLALVACHTIASAADTATLTQIDQLYLHRDQPENLQKSEQLLEQALAAQPEDADLLWRRGRGKVRLGELERGKAAKKLFSQAEEDARRAAAIDPKQPEARFWLGIAMGRKGELEPAWKKPFLMTLAGKIQGEMRAVLALDPKHAGAHQVLGEIQMDVPWGDKHEAVRELEQAVAVDPRYTAAYPSLIDAYLKVGERAKAEEIERKLLQVSDPEDPGDYADNVKDARRSLERR